ncbi:MAG: DUF4386 domain-containing protein [Sediminibacterium sp.]|nr:DUF4386 domain-containing protein [Sediminibacterium sp.]
MKQIKTMKKNARLAGLLYFLQIPLGVFGIIYVPKIMTVPGNLPATISNMLQHELLFRLSIVSAILCALITVATAFYLYKVLKPVNGTIAKMIVVFALLMTPIFMLNELNHIAILLSLKMNTSTTPIPDEQIHNMVSFFLNLHQYGMQIIGIFFGLWLLPMGYLVIKSGYIPKLIGYFLLITCLAYLIDFTVFFLHPTFSIVFSEYTWLGEVMMVTWLLTKGIKEKEYEKRLQITV